MVEKSEDGKCQLNSDDILIKEDGSAVEFYMSWRGRNSEEGAAVKKLVENHGGVWVKSWTPSCLELVSPQDEAIASRILKPGQVYYLSTFVHDCVHEKTLLDTAPYELKAPEIALKTKIHNVFTQEEDQEVIEYVRKAEKLGPSVNGDKFWQFAQQELKSVHTWQSMKNRWKKHLYDRFVTSPVKVEKSNAGDASGPLPETVVENPHKKQKILEDDNYNKVETENGGSSAVQSQSVKGRKDALKQAGKTESAAMNKVGNEDEVQILTKGYESEGDLSNSQKERIEQMKRGVDLLKEQTNMDEAEVLNCLIAASGDFHEAKRLLQKQGSIALWTEEDDSELLKLGCGTKKVATNSKLVKKFGKAAVESRHTFLTSPIQSKDP